MMTSGGGGAPDHFTALLTLATDPTRVAAEIKRLKDATEQHDAAFEKALAAKNEADERHKSADERERVLRDREAAQGRAEADLQVRKSALDNALNDANARAQAVEQDRAAVAKTRAGLQAEFDERERQRAADLEGAKAELAARRSALEKEATARTAALDTREKALTAKEASYKLKLAALKSLD
jgi:chromosome segregation ATPase